MVLRIVSVLILSITTGVLFGQKKTHTIRVNKVFSFGSVETVDIISSKRNIIVKNGAKNKVGLQLVFDARIENADDIDWMDLLMIGIDSSKKGVVEVYAPGVAGLSKEWLKGHRDNFAIDGEVVRRAREAQRNPDDPVVKRRGEILNELSKQRVDFTIIVSIPEHTTFNVYNAYSDVVVNPEFGKMTAVLKGSTLSLPDGNHLKLEAENSTVSVGNCKIAQIDFKNGTLSGGSIDRLYIKSVTSTIDYAGGSYAQVDSEGDKINIDSLQEADVIKKFGHLQIDRLTGGIQMKGENADLRILQTTDSLKNIEVINTFANVQIPLRSLKGYTVRFTGEHSTCFAPFEKNETDEKGNPTGGNTSSLTAPGFTAKSGTAPFAKITIDCDNCNVNLR
ncbi:MAG: hypothetical protein M9904_01805 [Chitinophagaceae bacterium]|nr:hypothetical protein [Chitinophagaceae bacterium]